jgi:RNA polymerase sigma factor (sigma-70 family)
MNKVDEILKRYPYITDDIQKAQAELNRYIGLQQDARNPLKGQAMDGMPHGSGVSDQTYNAVERLIDLYQAEINKYVAEINELINTKKWLDKAFESLTVDERRIVYLYYDKRISINKLSYMIRCSRHTIYKMLEETKEKIKKVMLM